MTLISLRSVCVCELSSKVNESEIRKNWGGKVVDSGVLSIKLMVESNLNVSGATNINLFNTI